MLFSCSVEVGNDEGVLTRDGGFELNQALGFLRALVDDLLVWVLHEDVDWARFSIIDEVGSLDRCGLDVTDIFVSNESLSLINDERLHVLRLEIVHALLPDFVDLIGLQL